MIIFQDFTVYIDGDLLLAIIATIAAAFFFFIYQGITLGRRRRKKREAKGVNPEGQSSQRDLRKTSEYWTETRAKKLMQTGKLTSDENTN